VIVKIESKPLDRGRSMIRSMVTVSNRVASAAGVMGKGGAFGHVVFALLLWQVVLNGYKRPATSTQGLSTQGAEAP
jgi:hypothetical protein